MVRQPERLKSGRHIAEWVRVQFAGLSRPMRRNGSAARASPRVLAHSYPWRSGGRGAAEGTTVESRSERSLGKGSHAGQLPGGDVSRVPYPGRGDFCNKICREETSARKPFNDV